MENKSLNADELQKRLDYLMGITEKEAKEVKAATASSEYGRRFWDYARGITPRNALKEGLDGSGGVLVPDTFEATLIEALESENVFRRLGRTIQLKNNRKFPVVTSHGSASWIEETGVYEESDDTFGQILLSAYKATTLMKLSDELLEDSVFDISDYIAKEFGRRIGKLEEEAFADGDGIKKPTGILRDATEGVITAETRVIGMDDLFDLYGSLSSRYSIDAVWVMTDSTYKTINKIRSGHGRNLWEPSLTKGAPQKLLNRQVEICDSMPDIASGSKSILFGNFQYYLIADRGNRVIKRLNELYAATGQVGFIASERVDAKLVLPEAVKYLQVQ